MGLLSIMSFIESIVRVYFGMYIKYLSQTWLSMIQMEMVFQN